MRRILSGPLTALVVPALIGALVGTTFPRPASAASSRVTVGPEEEDDEDLVIIEEGEMEGEEETPPADGEEPAGEAGDVGSELFGEDAATDEFQGTEPPADADVGKEDPGSKEKQIRAEMGLITVVQRQRMLKKKRFELSPQVGITVNDPYVRHYTLGVDLNYWLTNRMALGVTGTGFIGAKTPRYDNIRFQEGLLLTANQVLGQASVNFLYNPIYGKIAIFNRALLHWEASVMVGGGYIGTRVIPRYESLHEPFTNHTGGGHFGLMGRFYVPKIDWVSFNWGVRTWVFADRLEPAERGPNTNPMRGGTDRAELDDPDAAKEAAELSVAFNVTVFLGVSFYLPTSFEYTTPR